MLVLLCFSLFSASIGQVKSPVSLRMHLLSGNSKIAKEVPFSLADSLGNIGRSAPENGRSPALAIVFSAVIPGAGQVYASRYWTIPLIWGFGYWFTRQYIRMDDRYREWKLVYSRSLEGGGLGDAHARYIRDAYRDLRDEFAFYLVLTYVLNLVDAYVGASLYNFDVSEDLGGAKSIRVEARIPIR